MKNHDMHACLRLLGQAVMEKDTVRLFHTGQGVETWMNGSWLRAEFESADTGFEEWIRVLMDGYEMIRMPLESGRVRVTLIRNLTPGTWHHIRIMKEVQAMEGSPEGLKLLSLESDGDLEVRTPRKPEILFLGDSLTSGEGLGGARGLVDWKSCTFSTRGHYAYAAAEKLGMEPVLQSQCGWGACRSWDNHPDQHARRLLDGMHRLYAKDVEAEPEKLEPRAVVINLGTNDNSAFGGNPYTDPEGRVYRLRRDAQGRRVREDEEVFLKSMQELLDDLEARYPGVPLVWAYGMCGHDLKDLIQEGLDRHADAGGPKIPLLLLPACPEEEEGSNHHPGAQCHRKAGLVIAAYLKTLPGMGRDKME